MYSRLRQGRVYAKTPPTGAIKGRHGRFEYWLNVPASYDPARQYQVRIQLHGGVMRDQSGLRGDGSVRLPGAEQIYISPAGWSEAPWWSDAQVDNLRAILDAGTIKWRIPFGEYPELVAKGLRHTGSDNYGGPVVTAGGLLFIGATNFDRKFHAYDKLTGKLLWESTLPAAGNATPSIYTIDGREYVVIVCGGGKNDAPSGSSIVAFALPR